MVLSVAIFASAPTQAADLDVSLSRHVDIGKTPQKAFVVAQNTEVPQRSCGWLGPGGRAVYRCR
jgi:hypothetical protein